MSGALAEIAPAVPGDPEDAKAGLQDVHFRLLGLEPENASDLNAFAAMSLEQASYFHDNDLIGLPKTKADVHFWLNRFGRRIVVAGYSPDGRCLGFSGADRHMSWSDAVEKTSVVATLFYGVCPGEQRRGLAHAMARLVIARLAIVLGPQAPTCHIALQCRRSNTASQRVAAAIGMARSAERDFTGALSHNVPRHDYLGYEAEIGEVLGDSVKGLCRFRRDSTRDRARSEGTSALGASTPSVM